MVDPTDDGSKVTAGIDGAARLRLNAQTAIYDLAQLPYFLQQDIRGGAFGNNQEIGINLGVPDGQWMSGMFLRSNASGQPRLASFDVPVDSSQVRQTK